MKRLPTSRREFVLVAANAMTATAAADEIRVGCYSDGNECEVTQHLTKWFEAQKPDVKVVIDKAPYKAIVEQLPVQLAAAEGPDIARVTDLAGLEEVLRVVRTTLSLVIALRDGVSTTSICCCRL